MSEILLAWACEDCGERLPTEVQIPSPFLVCSVCGGQKFTVLHAWKP